MFVARASLSILMFSGITACGRIGFDSLALGPESSGASAGASGDAAVTDADSSGGTCPGCFRVDGSVNGGGGASGTDGAAGGIGGASGTDGAMGGVGGASGTDGATGGVGGSSRDGGSEWWDSNWTRRVKVTIDGTKLTGSETNPPILVSLDPTRIDYSATKASGADLRFVDEDDTTVLSSEIEQWSVRGTSTTWVRVPALAPGRQHVLWLYYDGPTTPAGPAPSTTWDASYHAVYHLNGGSADSTSYGNSGVETDVTGIAGQVANARSFDGKTSHAVIGEPASLNGLFKTGGTIEAWIRPVTYGQNEFGRIVDKANTIDGGGGWLLQVVGRGTTSQSLLFERGFDTAFGGWLTADGSIPLGEWRYVAVTFDDRSSANVPFVYIDGKQQPLVVLQTPQGTAEDDSSRPLWIADFNVDGSRTFDGGLDEIRFSPKIRPAGYFAFQYLSMTGQVVTFAPEERYP